MRKLHYINLLAVLILSPWTELVSSQSLPDDPPLIGHAIEARLDPSSGKIQATDQITLPQGIEQWDLLLHGNLDPTVLSDNATLEALGQQGHLELLRLRVTGPGPVTLAYSGRIQHALSSANEGMGRERQSTPGTIGPDGIFLDGNSGWYPRVPGSLQRFELAVDLPDGWRAISQGAGPGTGSTNRSLWSESQPQDDIYLIAAPFTLYRDGDQNIEAQVWLRRPDEPLAQRYLAATRQYLDLYSRLIGPYPYAKFALVENFWETGYGMPSFTLLGPQVLRLPFIIESSYPHEILHNWWGNGVFIDAQTGNWSEGLTAYLADHLLKEQQGLGPDYRRGILKSYANYVRGGNDIPLTQFRGRHSSASQAIGYGKSAMLFHMLRRQMGDERFKAGLSEFYRENRFRNASYDDLRRAFEITGGRDLDPYFRAWTGRTGAPRLGLSDVRLTRYGSGFRVSGRVDQTQFEAPYPLWVPVVIHQERGAPRTLMVEFKGRSARFETVMPSYPVRLAVDPAFDSFRDLMPGESPVALSNLFGAEKGLILLPSKGDPALLEGYRALAQAWIQGHAGWSISTDRETRTLPTDRPAWILGWENRLARSFAEDARGFELDLRGGALKIGKDSYTQSNASPVLTRARDGQPFAWMAAANPAALPGLARKVPHYGKYGYLVFTGAAPENIAKGQWPAGDSELVHWFTDNRPDLEPIPEPMLAPPEDADESSNIGPPGVPDSDSFGRVSRPFLNSSDQAHHD